MLAIIHAGLGVKPAVPALADTERDMNVDS